MKRISLYRLLKINKLKFGQYKIKQVNVQLQQVDQSNVFLPAQNNHPSIPATPTAASASTLHLNPPQFPK